LEGRVDGHLERRYRLGTEECPANESDKFIKTLKKEEKEAKLTAIRRGDATSVLLVAAPAMNSRLFLFIWGMLWRDIVKRRYYAD
jgi:hypothetical protein